MTKYYILDTETTGLDPAVHGVIDATFIGVNIRQVNGATEVNRGDTHVFQFPLTFADNGMDFFRDDRIYAAVEDEALQVNGYTFERLQERNVSLVNWLIGNWKHYWTVVNSSCFIGANIAFDVSFLNAFHRKVRLAYPDIELPRMHYKHVDIQAMAAQANGFGASLLSLQSLCDWYEIKRAAPHTATGDAEDTLDVLNKLIDQQNAMRSGQVSR